MCWLLWVVQFPVELWQALACLTFLLCDQSLEQALEGARIKLQKAFT